MLLFRPFQFNFEIGKSAQSIEPFDGDGSECYVNNPKHAQERFQLRHLQLSLEGLSVA